MTRRRPRGGVPISLVASALLLLPAPLLLVAPPPLDGFQDASAPQDSGAATRTSPSTSRPSPAAAPGFRTLSSPGIAVHYLPLDSARAARVLRFLEAQPPLPALPDTLPFGVDVYLAPAPEMLQELAGGRVPEWGAGVAITGLSRIVMPTYGGANTRGRSEERVLRHEWAHVALDQFLDGLRAPRWFNEGYADWASGGWNAQEGWRLRIGLSRSGGPTLDSLSLDWPRDRASAELAYMLGGTALEYLVRRSGVRGLTLFLERWKEVGSFERAFREVYGVTTAQFEEDWREYVKSRYGWLFVLSHSVVFWLFLALLLIGMMWIRRRRNREAMARLRATEPPSAPTWWAAWEEGSEEVGTGASKRAPAGASKEASEGGSERAPEGASHRAREEASERARERAPERPPERAPEEPGKGKRGPNGGSPHDAT